MRLSTTPNKSVPAYCSMTTYRTLRRCSILTKSHSLNQPSYIKSESYVTLSTHTPTFPTKPGIPIISITQKGPIKNFEIFALDLCAPSSRYSSVIEATHINEKNERDYIVAATKQVLSLHSSLLNPL